MTGIHAMIKALNRLKEYASVNPNHDTDEIVRDAQSFLDSIGAPCDDADLGPVEAYDEIWGIIEKNTTLDEVSVDFLTDQIMDVLPRLNYISEVIPDYRGNILHIYGQSHPHDDVWISGDRLALLAFRDCINSALEEGSDQSDSFTSDGEGYTVRVRCELPEVIKGYSPPYSKDGGEYPWFTQPVKKND